VRVLVTNDDGISAPGLHAVAEELVESGHDVLVVAPLRDCSGQSAALGPLHVTGKIEFERVEIDGIDAEAIAVDGPPALCVMSACLGGFGPPPEVVVSGINAGANTGRAVLHSGTVGAAFTGLNFGLPGVAVSQALGDPRHWPSAAALACRVLDTAASFVEPARPAVFNLNVPNLALDDIAGLASAVLDTGGTVQMALVEKEAGVLELDIPRRESHDRPDNSEGTDTHLLEAGYATVTALCGPRSLNHRYAVDFRRLSLSLPREDPEPRAGRRRRRRKSA
jgi:5'-nucleotidase